MAGGRSEESGVFAGAFPAASREDWLALVASALKGRPFDTLVSQTHDGVPLGPIYERAAASRPVVARVPAQPWRIVQRLDHPDPAAANAQALHDLENGATDLQLVFSGGVNARGYGLSSEGLSRTLEGVHLDAGIALELDLPAAGARALEALLAAIERHKVAPSATAIRFGLDPIGAMAGGGAAKRRWREVAEELASGAATLAQRGFAGPFVAADARLVHAAGGSNIQELAFALAAAVTYLRALEEAGMSIEMARGAISFRLIADAEQMLTIAKLRALRKLWARVEQACGLDPRPAFVSVETAWRMMTRRDPHVNMLRTTLAAFSAAVGGADAITVLPFTAALGLPDHAARRIARNTQLLLAEESSLFKVADPAAGSGAVETLTRQFCEAAWAQFQGLEQAGGVVAALEEGSFQAQVAAVKAARQRAVAHRRDPLTGTTEFPHLDETLPAVLDVASSPPPLSGAAGIEALRPMRLAEPFEALRDASDRMLAATGRRPRIFLAALGAPDDFTARVDFARGLFEAGGIAAVLSGRQDDLESLVAAFKASQTTLACLCGSDAAYERAGTNAARALAQAGAAHIYLAGKPREQAALTEAGVEQFIHAGCDALATLRAAHDSLRAG